MTRFCALSGGSFTELPTNTVVLDEVKADRHFSALVRGSLPMELLPNVLHEATHHWSFFSTTGNLLTLLRARFQQRCMSLTEARPIFDDYLRFETGTALRPIAEGLALFAEFDLLPGEGDVRALPLSWMLALFRRDLYASGPGTGELDRALHELLVEMRGDEELLRKKESLLVKPLRIDEGGYLAGYLGSSRKSTRVWRCCTCHGRNAGRPRHGCATAASGRSSTGSCRSCGRWRSPAWRRPSTTRTSSRCWTRRRGWQVHRLPTA